VSEIQQNRYDQLLRRVTGAIGPGSKVNDALTELFPMIDVENLPGELFLLSGTRLGFGGTSLGSAAGEFSSIQLFNPVDSQHIVTLQTVLWSSTTTQTVLFGIDTPVLTTATAAERNRDGRAGLLATLTVAQVRRQSLVAVGPATSQTRTLADTIVTLDDRNSVAVLPPGTGFSMTGATAATQTNCTFFWRERPAGPSELNF